MVAAAQRGEGTVGKLLTDDALYSNVNQFSSEGVKLIYDFRQNPKKYLTIKFQLF
jgi:phospholipid/cholesterol/gamma-HCH transport system substrate-binding protein